MCYDLDLVYSNGTI